MCRLLGPNGAGKSTSINMMIGFMEATEGEALINGRNIKTDMNEIYTFMARPCCTPRILCCNRVCLFALR